MAVESQPPNLAARGSKRVVDALTKRLAPQEQRFAAAPAFISSIPVSRTAASTALVIACNSHKFLPQTQEFLHKGLGLQTYDLIAIPGGVQWLTLPDILPKHNKVARWMTERLVHGHNLTRIICIAHDDCSAYTDKTALATLAHALTRKSVFEHQCDQLRKSGRLLADMFGVHPELYFAAASGDEAHFHLIQQDKE